VLGLALALSASVCWGLSDFLGGLQARHVRLLRVLLVSQGVGMLGLVVVIAARRSAPPDLVRLLPAIGAGVAGIAALAAFYRALAVGTMSIVAPVSATGVAVPVLVGVAGGERPAPLQLAGIAAAVLGVVLVSREPGAEADGNRSATRASVELALVAALGFGSYFVGIRPSAKASVLWALFASRGTGLLALAAAAVGRREPGKVSRAELVPLAVMGLLDLSATALYAIAGRHGLLSVVAVGASLYPLATVLLARLVLRERVRRIQELGIAAALAGVVMIAAHS
jgi:drug/metabolite transporter (DMT)-like permease